MRALTPLMFQVTIFMRDLPACAGGLEDREAGAAAAGRDGVADSDLEGLAHQVVDEIDHRAAHIDERQIVDQNGRAVASRWRRSSSLRLADEVELVGEAGAAAAFDRDAQRRLARLAGEDRGDARAARVASASTLSCRSCASRPSSRPRIACIRVHTIGMKRRWAKSTRRRPAMDRRQSLATSASATGRAPPMRRSGAIARPARRRAGKPDPHAFPARPRPHHPFHRLPAAEAQDAGVRRAMRATITARG